MLGAALALADGEVERVDTREELDGGVGRLLGGGVERDGGAVRAGGEAGVGEALADVNGARALDAEADLADAGLVDDLEVEVELEHGAGRARRGGGDNVDDVARGVILALGAEGELLAEVERVEVAVLENFDELLDADEVARDVADGDGALSLEGAADLGAASDDAHVEDVVEEDVETLLGEANARLAEARGGRVDTDGLRHGDHGVRRSDHREHGKSSNHGERRRCEPVRGLCAPEAFATHLPHGATSVRFDNIFI